jgi:hypothetical protein
MQAPQGAQVSGKVLPDPSLIPSCNHVAGTKYVNPIEIISQKTSHDRNKPGNSELKDKFFLSRNSRGQKLRSSEDRQNFPSRRAGSCLVESDSRCANRRKSRVNTLKYGCARVNPLAGKYFIRWIGQPGSDRWDCALYSG